MNKFTALLAAAAFIASTSLVAAMYVPSQSGIASSNVQLVAEKDKDKDKDKMKKKDDKKKDDKMKKDDKKKG